MNFEPPIGSPLSPSRSVILQVYTASEENWKATTATTNCCPSKSSAGSAKYVLESVVGGKSDDISWKMLRGPASPSDETVVLAICRKLLLTTSHDTPFQRTTALKFAESASGAEG